MVKSSAAAHPSDAVRPILHSDSLRTEPAALRVVGLEKRYEKLQAVDGLSFEIQPGEVFGLLGPNGAGKTTTISVLATRMKPSRGDAQVFGHSVTTDLLAVRELIGVVPQELSLYPKLTAAENIRFFGRMYGVPPAELEDRIDSLLGLVGLDSRRHDYVATFSGGMKRRLNLAVSLVHAPKLLLLDEPTVGVDPQSRQHIFEIVRRLREEGTAILYTTHYMEEAETLCDRLGIMDEGRIIATGTLDTLLSDTGCAEVIEIRGLPTPESVRGLQSLAGVCQVDVHAGVVKLFVSNAAQLLGPLQQVVGPYADRISLQIEPLSLGDLFLRLTGKELRD